MNRRITLTIHTKTGRKYYWFDETGESSEDYLIRVLPQFKRCAFIGVKNLDGSDTFLATELIENVDFGKIR